MSLYQQLKSQKINLSSRASTEFDAGEGAIMIPNPNSKIFVHWLTENGKMRATFTMTYATKIKDKVKLTNGMDSPTEILVILST